MIGDKKSIIVFREVARKTADENRALSISSLLSEPQKMEKMEEKREKT